jgi:hypothetical protein
MYRYGFDSHNLFFMSEPFCQIRAVTITVKGCSTKYAVLKSLRHIQDFAEDLRDVTEDGIEIEDSSSPRKFEEAVKTIYTNIIISFPEGDARNQFVASALWQMQLVLFQSNIDCTIYCLNELHKMAPTSFEKARLLLCGQCNPDLTPLTEAEWNVIGSAILLLKNEKNGDGIAARDLLQTLKNTGKFEALLGNWPERRS